MVFTLVELASNLLFFSSSALLTYLCINLSLGFLNLYDDNDAAEDDADFLTTLYYSIDSERRLLVRLRTVVPSSPMREDPVCLCS